MQWLEQRLPIGSFAYSSFRRLSDAAQLELLVDVRRHSHLHAWCTDRYRRRAGDALHAACRLCLQFRRVDHARRELRLAAALSACQWRFVLFRRGLRPHRAQHVLRLLQGSARGVVDPRRYPVPLDGRHGLHGLRAALGPDELLGGDRHHQPVLGDPLDRRSDRHLAVGRLSQSAIRRSTASIRCTTCCRSSSPASSCLHIWALHVVGQNNPTGVEARAEKDTVAFTPYATIKDLVLHSACSVCSSPGSCSTSPTISSIPTTTSRPIPARRRPTSCRNGITCRSTPFCAAIPNKLLGVIALFASIVLLAFLPWLDTSHVRSANYRPLYRQFLIVFFLRGDRARLSGSQPPEGGYVIAARILTAYYFVFLLHHLAAARVVRTDQAATDLDLGIGAGVEAVIGREGLVEGRLMSTHSC